MNRQTSVRWNLIVLLAVLGLVRPLLSISGVYDSLGGGPWASVFVTIMIAAVWVGAVVAFSAWYAAQLLGRLGPLVRHARQLA